MSAKKIPREFVETFAKMATKPPVPQTATVDIKPVNVMGTVSKWVPLICAGAAVGVSIMALKEIHNVRKELVLAKKELKGSDDLTKRMEMMEQQLKTISEFIKNSKPKPAPPPPVPKKSILKQVVENAPEVRIINENEKYDSNEYEEVEVTDDEAEETEEEK